jgi:hypothetical protein
MPSSYADSVQDWELLLAQVRESSMRFPHVEGYLDELSAAVDEAKQAKVRQELHANARLMATQDLGNAMEAGKEAAVKLRGYLRSRLGPKNELLPRFGIAPVGKRSRRGLKPPPVE